MGYFIIISSLMILFLFLFYFDIVRIKKLEVLRDRIKKGENKYDKITKFNYKNIDLGLVAIEVAARLRAGANAAKAWQESWKRIVGTKAGPMSDEGVPLVLEKIAKQAHSNNRNDLFDLSGFLPGRKYRIEFLETAWILAVSCKFSHRTGAPIATVLEETGKNLALTKQVRGEQEVAFSGPKISVKILAGLPLVGIALSFLIGANPIAWFFSGFLPFMVAVAGFVFFSFGVLTSVKWVNTAEDKTRGGLMAPFISDLVVSGLTSGASIPSALLALSQAADDKEYKIVSQQLVLGSRWQDAWNPLPKYAELLEKALRPAWEDGVSPVVMLNSLSSQLRQNQSIHAREMAGKLGVKLAIPLAGFLLPAFILLTIVPVVATLFPSLGF